MVRMVGFGGLFEGGSQQQSPVRFPVGLGVGLVSRGASVYQITSKSDGNDISGLSDSDYWEWESWGGRLYKQTTGLGNGVSISREVERLRAGMELMEGGEVGKEEVRPEFLGWCREFVAGGFGGMAGVISGHPLDTLRVRLQQPAVGGKVSSTGLLRSIVASEGPSALYRGMTTPLVSVAFQNALVFQVYAVLSRALNSNGDDPPSYRSVSLAGVGTGAVQTLMLTPVELVKIRLQLQTTSSSLQGPVRMARNILRKEGVRGLYRGLSITVLRDAPAHGVYFWTYEYAREKLHPGCRKTGDDTLDTMLFAGGLAGVSSWLCCYPLDVIKSRLQGQSQSHKDFKYSGIVDCFRKSVQEEGYRVLWRGLGTTVARAFLVNGAIFSAYQVALRFLSKDDHH